MPLEVTWLGHATLLVASSTTRVIVDPWLEGNPRRPADIPDLNRLDGIAVTHGHFDHMASVVSLVQETGAPVLCNSEISAYLGSRGVSERLEMNKGGTREIGDLQITMVSADHSGGIDTQPGEPNLEGGSAAGFIIRESGGNPCIYISGDTNVFGDMALIRELYHPRVGFVPIDGHYNMGPREAALAVSLLGLDRVVPIHFGTFPVLRGRPAELQDDLVSRDVPCEMVVLEPGQSLMVK